MPKRGEHREAIVPDSAAAQPAVSQIGVRQVTFTEGGRTSTVPINPAAYRCATIVGQLAEEWASYVDLGAGGGGMVYSHRKAITEFADYVDQNCPDPEGASLSRDVPDLAFLASEMWRKLPSLHRPGSTIPIKRAHALRGMLRFRAQREGSMLAEGLLRLVSAPHGVGPGKSKELDEYSRQEKQALIRASWKSIRDLEDRLVTGRKMIAAAVGHPEQHGWLNANNLLWALSERQVTGADIFTNLPPFNEWPVELAELASWRNPVLHRTAKWQLITVLFSLRYPRDADLHAFRVLLMSATGRTPEEVTGLNVGDVEFTPSGVRLTMTKNRSHMLRHQVFADGAARETVAPAGRDGQTVSELIRRLMDATQQARHDYSLDPTPLFLRVTTSDHGRMVTACRMAATHHGEGFGWWVKSMGLELSAPADIRRLRKSGKVEKVIARRGVVSDIADDHTVETFKGHYAHGTTVHVISGHVVNSAQNAWFDAAIAGPVSLDSDAADRLNEPEALNALGITSEQAGQIIGGELDMGVTTCRDPFDSPYSKPGELCAVAPLRCLECQNAFILPSNLPQLLLFSDHLEHLRLRLTPPHFHALWGQSLTNLEAVLRERTPAEINAARLQIQAQSLALQLPLAARAEFDL